MDALRDPETVLWVSYIHHTWWPSFVVGIDALGQARLAFVSAGHSEAVGEIQIGGRPHLVATGVNNEFRSAAVALVDPSPGASTSPQSVDSAFACDGCAPSKPLRYTLLPRSELNIAAGHPYNFADQIESARNASHIEISVREDQDKSLRSIYGFSAVLEPRSISMSDWYWETHRQLFDTGKLDHSVEKCPARTTGVLVRVWEPDRGWTDVHVPPLHPPVRTAS